MTDATPADPNPQLSITVALTPEQRDGMARALNLAPPCTRAHFDPITQPVLAQSCQHAVDTGMHIRLCGQITAPQYWVVGDSHNQWSCIYHFLSTMREMGSPLTVYTVR